MTSCTLVYKPHLCMPTPQEHIEAGQYDTDSIPNIVVRMSCNNKRKLSFSLPCISILLIISISMSENLNEPGTGELITAVRTLQSLSSYGEQ